MKTIIAGSRSFRHPADYTLVEDAVRDSGFQITEVVFGGAKGVDRLGLRYARAHGIPIREFYAPWHSYPVSAGMIRNVFMAEYADALIAVWDGVSKGTAHMIETATKHGLQVHVLDGSL